jgi:hypothetical protein
MGRVSHLRRHRRSQTRPFALRALLSGSLIAIICVQAASPARAYEVLTDDQMDDVTAGKMTMDLELSANADGASVMTSTQGTVQIGQTKAVRIEVNDAAPPQASARLLGSVNVEVGIAAGKAQASGGPDATCAANTGFAGADYTYINRSQNFTAVAATCSCTALAVGIQSQ